MEVREKGKEVNPVEEKAMNLIQSFTDYKPKKGDDTIRYLYKAREIANCYDQLTQCENIDEEANTLIFMEYLLQMCPFYKDFHQVHS